LHIAVLTTPAPAFTVFAEYAKPSESSTALFYSPRTGQRTVCCLSVFLTSSWSGFVCPSERCWASSTLSSKQCSLYVPLSQRPNSPKQTCRQEGRSGKQTHFHGKETLTVTLYLSYFSPLFLLHSLSLACSLAHFLSFSLSLSCSLASSLTQMRTLSRLHAYSRSLACIGMYDIY